MKKTLTTLIIIFCTLSLFAETGYGKLQWNITENETVTKIGKYKLKELSKQEERIFFNELITEEKMYFYIEDCLTGIGYITENEKIDLLNYGSFFRKQTINGTTLEELKKLWLELRAQEYENEVLKELQIRECYYKAIGSEFDKEDVITESDMYKEQKSCTLYIYDYNDDTRVYIYENIIKDQTIVVYVPHEQDY